MRVLVIGSGSIGRRHADNLAALGATPRLLSWREAGFDGGGLAAIDAVEIDLLDVTVQSNTAGGFGG